jgi:glycogen debranching enzyme
MKASRRRKAFWPLRDAVGRASVNRMGTEPSSNAPSPFAGTTPVPSSATLGAVTLVEGQSFCVSGRAGDITADFPHGLFLLDTRIVSGWSLRLNGHRVEPLGVDVHEPFGATFLGRSAPAEGHADAEVVILRHRHVGQGMRERIVVRNHGLRPVPMALHLAVDADFADLFAVKEGRARALGQIRSDVDDGSLHFEQRSDTGAKDVRITASPSGSTGPGSIDWEQDLEPGAAFEVCIQVTATISGIAVEPRFRCGDEDGDSLPSQRMATWHATLPKVETASAPLAQTLARSAEDLGALRIFDADHPELPILAAGAPWFMTVFGRDSLLTAWMTLIADPSLAHGVLETLARFQGQDVDPKTEEEPGKILHEMRFGSTTNLALGGGDVYYGSVDATPLFVMLLGELRRWDARDELVDRLLPHADRALAWIDEHGDRDGDGYVEYQRSTDDGLANQGWKDSWDAVRHRDGSLATTPIALCEVQGYVYAAYVARVHLAREAGDTATAQRYAAKASALRRRFNEDFWSDEHGWYVLALDGDKRPVDVLSSNIGHCLWSGIIDPARAGVVAERLLSPDMFSGFGVRTLSASAAAYNPVSYHNGSVWPHDNALCAAGLARYGFIDAAHRIIEAQLDVARAHDGRLPELFTGFSRDEFAVPASYPASCAPQAWAAASPMLWLRTLLRFDPHASDGTIWLDPQLPDGFGDLTVSGIRVGPHDLAVTVSGGRVDVHGAADLRVVRHARPPLSEVVHAPPGS